MHTNNKNKRLWKNEHGAIHRNNGPAVEYANGLRMWFVNGKLHREDGPAIEFDNGIRMWYLNHLIHRDNGPAVEYSDGETEWYLNGNTVDPFLTKIGDIVYKNEQGRIVYIEKRDSQDKFHCENNPAIIRYSDSGEEIEKEWYVHGKRHRMNGPAIETKYVIEYWENGFLHRNDGPSVIYLENNTDENEKQVLYHNHGVLIEK